MIFAITGTHEQPFDRLVRAVDEYAADHRDEHVVIQSGYSRHTPRHASYEAMYGQEDMQAFASEAKVIVTHAGPGSVWLAFRNNKIPLVVPRMKRFGEHVDDHQVAFAKHLESAGRAPFVSEVDRLPELISNYRAATSGFALPSDVAATNRKRLFELLEQMVDPLSP